jgi:DUF438 domain-containing protein
MSISQNNNAFWKSSNERAQSEIINLRQSFNKETKSIDIQRVSQLDASLLDEELKFTLLDYMNQAVSLFKVIINHLLMNNYSFLFREILRKIINMNY